MPKLSGPRRYVSTKKTTGVTDLEISSARKDHPIDENSAMN
jgi:hypothetical protein